MKVFVAAVAYVWHEAINFQQQQIIHSVKEQRTSISHLTDGIFDWIEFIM